MRTRLRLCAGLALLPALGACTAERGGRLEVKWTGADTGRLVAPATAEWCATGKYVRVEALHGDTGVAVAVFPVDTALSGHYTLSLAHAESARPSGVVALRWFDAMTLAGFRSDSGSITLHREPKGGLSGELRADGRLVGPRPKNLRVVGQFRGLTVRPASRDCPALPEPRFPNARPGGAGVDSSHGDDIL
jgi:hypothetical protein